ncbi:alpha/beta fold hydrolase [Micromonospora sp. WMMD987]|jgi:surfactin synthase thioesterase subunit|uniref:thioesterase II family protein n=1 Tax=Micromonospora TaxID=1873 RepID=UPI00249B810C|nr:alpha/beta fold hydrolase [Micromonospora sp. WMMD987]WFE97234.1 alpha/beta fold hydrolase [Micromonospora sp. WMMD987]
MTATLENDLWVRRFHPAPSSALRLVALPHAGGSASYLFPVSRALSPGVEVLAIQYPGRQDRRHEPVLDTVAGLVDGVFAALRPWLDRPVAIFGHSMGAVLGYELGLRLQRETGRPPVRLFASGRRAPSRTRDERYVHTRDDAGVLRELARLSGSDPRVLGDPELLPMILPALRGDYKAVETYRAEEGARLDAPITVLTGDSDPMTTVDEAGDWRLHTTGECDVRVFRGGHFFLNEHAAEVIRLIGDELGRPLPEAPAG